MTAATPILGTRLAADLAELDALPADLWRVLRQSVRPRNIARARYRALLADGTFDADLHRTNLRAARGLLALYGDDADARRLLSILRGPRRWSS